MSLSAQSWQYRDTRNPEVGSMPYSYRMTSMILYSSQCHRQHCTPHAFEQFGALYMHNTDDKYPARLGFEPSTSEFRATTGPNKPSAVTFIRSIPTLKQLHWFTVKFRMHFKICTITFRTLKNNKPAYLSDLLVRPK